MKSLIAILALTFSLIGGNAYAASGVMINHVNCGGAKFGAGAVSVTFAGMGFFNITEYSPAGFPFFHQAQIVNSFVSRSEVTFFLKSTLTGVDYYLVLFEGSFKGKISTKHAAMDITCLGKIDVVP